MPQPFDQLVEVAGPKRLCERVEAPRQRHGALRQGQQVSYDSALEMAANTQALMHTTEDHAEGVAALIEKRTPDFKGS